MRFKDSVLVEAYTSNNFILKQNIFLAPALQQFFNLYEYDCLRLKDIFIPLADWSSVLL